MLINNDLNKSGIPRYGKITINIPVIKSMRSFLIILL